MLIRRRATLADWSTFVFLLAEGIFGVSVAEIENSTGVDCQMFPVRDANPSDKSLTDFIATIDDSGKIEVDGPSLWGTGMDPGPASLEERSAEAAEWRASVSPERARFKKYGRGGPPTAEKRKLAMELSVGFACRACHHLLLEMWQNLTEPSELSIKKWLAHGCTALVRKHQLEKGLAVTEKGCDGAGYRTYEGTLWCLLQDAQAEIVRKPDLAQEYHPAKDALYLACHRTLGANGARVVRYLLEHRGETRAKQRNERLAGQTCVEAACCGSY